MNIPSWVSQGLAQTVQNKVSNFVSKGLQSNLDNITRASSAVSAKNLEYAQQQQDWSANQAAIANNFNAAEAAKNRDWQEYMSNTAHQREVKDLKAAGLNPVLSAMNGNGAAVTSGAAANASLPSGASASASDPTQAIVGVLSAMLSAQTSIANTAVSAKATEAVADKYTAMSKLVAEMDNATRRYTTEYATDSDVAIRKYAADLQNDASRYGSYLSWDAATSIAANQLAWQSEHPNSMWQMIGDIVSGFSDSSPGGTAKSLFEGAKSGIDKLVASVFGKFDFSKVKETVKSGKYTHYSWEK